MIFKNKEGDEIENRGPYYRLEGGQYFSRNNSGDGIGGIVKAIYKIKDQRQGYNDNEKCGHKLI